MGLNLHLQMKIIIYY